MRKNVEKEVENLKKDYDTKLKVLQEKCKHDWIKDGTDVWGYYSVQCYKCTVCGATKTER